MKTLCIVFMVIFMIFSQTVSLGQINPVKLSNFVLDNALGITFTPDGNEAFWTVPYRDARRTYIMHAKREQGLWGKAEKASFTTGTHQETMPRVSPDGNMLIFFSNRPQPQKQNPHVTDLDFWAMQRQGGVWGDPYPLTELNTDSLEYFGSFAKDGTLYFTSSRGGGMEREDIWMATPDRDGHFSTIANVGHPVNSTLLDSSPAVSPEGDYMIFFSANKIDEDFGAGDLYISFKSAGRWSKPQNLGSKVNTEDFELSPSISHDGSIIYFVRATPRGTGQYDRWNYQIFSIEAAQLDLHLLRASAKF